MYNIVFVDEIITKAENPEKCTECDNNYGMCVKIPGTPASEGVEATEDTYKCVCPVSRSGDNCEILHGKSSNAQTCNMCVCVCM